MTLHQLRMFSAVARHRNVTKAARELRLNQPATTYQMKLFQQEFGLLYKRAPRGVELTAHGLRLLRAIEPVLCKLDGISAKFGKRPKGKNVARLAIGGSNGPSAHFLPSLAARFRETHADIEVTLRVGSSLTLEKMVQSGEIEMAVVTHYAKSPALKYERCRREKLVFFARPGRYAPRMSLEELGGTPLILFRQGQAGAALKFLEHMEGARVTPNVAMRLESVEAVKSAVRVGTGVGMLYRDNLRSEIESGEFKVILIAGLDMRVESFIITPRKKPLSVAAEVFLQMLRSGRREPQTALVRGERKSVVNLVSLAPLWLSFIYSLIGQLVDDVSLLASALI